jgi:hypothetical protein
MNAPPGQHWQRKPRQLAPLQEAQECAFLGFVKVGPEPPVAAVLITEGA